jgi:UDP:flavonoid glycosyltransferase YjiC (YdhE family)
MQPHVVVAQYAPVAQVAARLSGLPCLTLNTGFEYPPCEAPFPRLRSNIKLTRKQLLDREVEILQYVNGINLREGHFSCNSLQEVFKSDINLLATFPEMDHYRQRRNGCYIGPISMLDNGVTLRWRKRGSLRIFVYLRPFPGIVAILEGLAGSGADVIAHIPGLDTRIRALYTNTSIRIADSTVRMSDILADMDVAITHAGHGTACAVLLAGVPLLMIPTTIEQWLTSCNIEALGAGISMKRERVAKTFAIALEKLLADHSYQEGAKKLAMKYAGYDQGRVISQIVNTIERLPGWVANRINRPEFS